jgi:hypothetical protein
LIPSKQENLMNATRLILIVILVIVAGLVLAVAGIVIRAKVPNLARTGGFEPSTDSTDDISIPVWGIAFPTPELPAGLFWVSSLVPLSDGGGIITGTCFHNENIDFFLAQFDKAGNVVHQHAYGGGRREDVSAARPLVTPDGGYMFTGTTNSFSDSGDSDGWLIKTGVGGAVEWSRLYGQPGKGTSLTSVKPLSSGGYVLLGTSTAVSGYSRDDWWVLRLDAEGRILWQKVYGGREKRDTPTDIIPADGGGFLCIGETKSFAPGSGYSNAWIVKLDSSGSIEWQKSFGSKGYNRARSATLVPNTGYALAGFITRGEQFDRRGWITLLDFGGEVLWQKLYGLPGNAQFNTITLMADGSFLAAGSRTAEGSEISEGFLLRLNADGTPRWQRLYTGPGNVLLNDGAEAADGGVLVLGRSSMPPDDATPEDVPEYAAFILKVTADGRPLVNRTKKSTFGVQADLEWQDQTIPSLDTEAAPIDTAAESVTPEGPTVTKLDLETVKIFPLDQ